MACPMPQHGASGPSSCTMVARLRGHWSRWQRTANASQEKRDRDSRGMAHGDAEGLAAAMWGPGWGAGPLAPVAQAATAPRGCLGVCRLPLLPQVPRPSGPAEGGHEVGGHSLTSLHVAPTVCRVCVGPGQAGKGAEAAQENHVMWPTTGLCEGCRGVYEGARGRDLGRGQP